MDKQEAKQVLNAKLEEYRQRSYAELQRLLATVDVFEITAGSGTWYQLEFQAVWDDKPGKNLRVFGTIDDGGLRAFFPLTEDFIISPEGSFVGE